MHIAPNAPDYNRYDTHNNYMDGVIVNPALVVAGKVRTADGRWAVCHPPNGVNLKNGAYGIRWWVSRDEWAGLDALWIEEDEEEEADEDADDWTQGLTADDWAEIARQEAKSDRILNDWIDVQNRGYDALVEGQHDHMIDRLIKRGHR